MGIGGGGWPLSTLSGPCAALLMRPSPHLLARTYLHHSLALAPLPHLRALVISSPPSLLSLPSPLPSPRPRPRTFALALPPLPPPPSLPPSLPPALAPPIPRPPRPAPLALSPSYSLAIQPATTIPAPATTRASPPSTAAPSAAAEPEGRHARPHPGLRGRGAAWPRRSQSNRPARRSASESAAPNVRGGLRSGFWPRGSPSLCVSTLLQVPKSESGGRMGVAKKTIFF